MLRVAKMRRIRKQVRLRKGRDAKWLPIREALDDVRKTFEAHRAVVDEEINAIEKAIGAKAMQDRLSDEGGLAFCALHRSPDPGLPTKSRPC